LFSQGIYGKPKKLFVFDECDLSLLIVGIFSIFLFNPKSKPILLKISFNINYFIKKINNLYSLIYLNFNLKLISLPLLLLFIAFSHGKLLLP